MTDRSRSIVTTLLLTLTLALAAVVPGLRADEDRLRNANYVLTEMAGSFDTGIPKSLFDRARCIVIIPSVRRLALGIGGQYGRGYLSCRMPLIPDTAAGAGENAAPDASTDAMWSPPAGIRIEGGSVGLQIGGSETDLILLVMNQRGAERLLSSRFTVGADAAVAAGPIGRQASAQTDATMMAEILAWSRTRGVYAGISLQGSTLREDSGENEDLYGREISNRAIVSGEVSVPEGQAKALIDALAEF